MEHPARLSILLLSVAALLSGVAAGEDEHAFVGSKKCKMCHIKEFKSWEASRMANTFDALLPGNRAEEKRAAGLDPAQDYTRDVTCLPCHVTGFGKKGGFSDLDSTPDRAGVGCESCHGPGGTYLEPEYMSLKNKEYEKSALVAVGMVGEITAQQCTGCHNADSPFVGDDFVFDFEANRAKGIHDRIPLKYAH